MKATTTKLENFQAEIVVTIPPDEIQKHFERNFEEAVKDIEVPGFRKGKAPRNVVKQQIDEDKLWKITLDEVVEETLSDALKEQNIQALKIIEINKDEHKPDEDFTYRAKIELMPEIPDVNYTEIPVRIHKVPVSEKMIDLNIENLRIRLASSTAITNRGAQKDDWAAIELEGHEFSRIKLPGQTDKPRMLFKTGLGIHLGTDRGISWLDEQIIGMKIGESKTAYVTMPKDFISPPMEEDKEIEARIKLHALEEKVLPELTDDFLVANQLATDLEHLKGQIRVNLEAQARSNEDHEATDLIQRWLIDNFKFDVPAGVLEEKKEELTEKLREEYQKQGEDLDIILKRVDEKATKIRQNISKLAEDQAKLDFVIDHIAKKEEIKVDQNELVNHIQIMAQYAKMKKHQVEKLLKDENFILSTYEHLLNRKVTNFLLNHAKREYITEDEEHEDEKEIVEKDDKSGGSGLIVTG